MSFTPIGLGASADDGAGDPARTGGQRINELIAAANAGQLQGFKNRIRNGDFCVAQRGATFNNISGSGTEAPHIDGWLTQLYGTTTDTDVTREDFSPGQTDVPGASHFLRISHTDIGGYNGGQYWAMQRIEDVKRIAGIEHTLSFYAKASTAYALVPQWFESFGSGGSSLVSGSFGTANLTTSWQQFSFTVTPDSISGKVLGAGDYFAVIFGGNDTATVDIDIADVQLEPGAIASPFERWPQAVQLAQCRRYYAAKTVRSENGSRHIPLTPMRSAPSVTVGVGSAANITADGFELTHTSAADCSVAANAEL